MHILTYIFKLAVATLPFLFSGSSTARAATPLEVRSPYFNFWTPIPLSEITLGDAEFFFTQAFSSRTALIQIDGVTHSIFGQLSLANQTNVTGTDISPTRTAFDFEIGPIALRATFFSPIEPDDWVRQSTPFTYLSFELEVTDSKAHDIQLYLHTVIGGFFLADADQNVTWSIVSTGSSVYEMAQLQNQQVFSENAFGQAEWGQFYFATAMGDVVTYGIGPADTLINTFTTDGSLNAIPSSPVEGTSNISTAFALSRNLGNVTNNATAIFALGFVQDPAVQYVDPAGQIHRRVPYFKTKYSNTGELIDAVISDFVGAWSRRRKLEGKIATTFDSAGFLGDYAILLSFATRLSYASTVLTVEESSEGVVDPTDVMMFMKNMGAAVSPNRVNPTEALYAAFPMFMYLDASLGALLLEPLLRYQNSSNYTQEYAGLDAGVSYPNVSFANSNHPQGVEQTANMLIMVYAHALASGNATLIEAYYPLLKRWSEYLVNTALFTTNQESADLLSVNNQTNLAIKGIIAIKAMSLMSAVVGKSTDYSVAADNFYARWKNLALGSDKHLLAQYGNKTSWSLGYNMFADLWLQTNLISQDIFTAHVNFLKTINISVNSATSIADMGIPLDSFRPDNITYASNMFAAGFADRTLQRLIVLGMEGHPVYNDVGLSNTTITAWSPSPDLGSVYAPLILASRSINGTTVGSHSSAAREFGIVLGSLLGCAAIASMLIFLYRRSRTPRREPLNMQRLFRERRWTSKKGDVVIFGETEDVLKLNPHTSLDRSTSTSTSVRVRREYGWKNFEDYDYE